MLIQSSVTIQKLQTGMECVFDKLFAFKLRWYPSFSSKERLFIQNGALKTSSPLGI